MKLIKALTFDRAIIVLTLLWLIMALLSHPAVIAYNVHAPWCKRSGGSLVLDSDGEWMCIHHVRFVKKISSLPKAKDVP